MNKTLRAKDIMTTYVKTVSPDMKIKDVWEKMTDYGHTGFPVVDGGKVVGIVTRSDLDRALRHNLTERRIEEFMSRGPIFVSPYEDVETIKDIFLRYGIGRVLVMEGDRLLGIITRTDLLQADRIDLYDKEKEESIYVKKRMQDILPSSILRLLEELGKIGDEFGYPVFIVGGIVRDILLGYKNLDIDIVVEGDGIRFAIGIKRYFDVDVKVFPDFGTASLRFKNGLRFDIATSRLEFYDYPGAPPKVEVTSIKKDLYRRDFTINALAIQINPEQFGKLFDFFGGRYDLEHKLIRILHNLSFVEDPSRILRAIRFETRYDFRIEDKTLYFLEKAVSENYIEKIKPPKLKEEFFYILEEENPLKPIVRLYSLGALSRIFPNFSMEPLLQDGISKIISRRKKYKDMVKLSYTYFFIILNFVRDIKSIEYILNKFSMPELYKEKIKKVYLNKKSIYRNLENAKRNSEIFKILYEYPLEILVMLKALSISEEVEKKIDKYIFELRNVRPILRGRDILTLGLEEGKAVGYVLEKLRDMRLDGEILTKEDEQKAAFYLIKKAKERYK